MLKPRKHSVGNMRAVVLLCLLHAVRGETYYWDEPGQRERSAGTSENECYTEQGSCHCCLMLQEMDRLRSHFHQMLNELEKVYLQTNKTFNQITTNRVAFSLGLFNNSRFKCVGPFTMNQVVPFKHAFLNLGGGYNSTNGIFTVPHAGLYSLALTVYSDAGTSGSKLAACAGLQVNGQVVAGASEKNNLDQEDSSSAAVALHLKAGDQVAVSLPPGCFLCDDSSHFNTFSGFLLYDE